MELRVNGVLAGSRLVSSTSVQDMLFATPTAIAAGDRIDVVFTNDALVNGEDRNLYVESITARGTRVPSTAAGVVIDIGQGVQATDGVNVIAAGSYGGWVPWNAAMHFVAP
jgi:Ca-dependent carbohydrate-binding module xylan-binding